MRAALSAAISLVLRLLGRDPDPAKSREHVLLSLLAFLYEFYFLYYVFLFKIIDKSGTLQNVILAFTRNSDQIFLTIIFESIIIYIYSSFAYFYVSESFYNYTIGSTGENLCVGMWHCFLTIFALVISPNRRDQGQAAEWAR